MQARSLAPLAALLVVACTPPLWNGGSGPRWLATFGEGTHTGFPDLAQGLLDGLDRADQIGCSSLEGTSIRTPRRNGGSAPGSDCRRTT